MNLDRQLVKFCLYLHCFRMMEIEETAFLVDLKATFMVVFLCSKSDVYSSPPKILSCGSSTESCLGSLELVLFKFLTRTVSDHTNSS